MKYILSTFMLAAAIQLGATVITSPSGELLLNVDVDAQGHPYYTLDYKGKKIVEPSKLGIRADETVFADGFTIAGIDTVTVDRSWEPVWGEYSTVRDHFREMAVKLKAENPDREMTVRFRLFDDGLGFRYELPVQKGPHYLTV
ncbi:MAG: glycoside hydrolase family 97 N-terminal domain-containing protein, partial [Muribaculaceae bacterium]|nr:glycoside hydrolase family 97 N-terminal domain-containing protein [Muribaculaceae bacterium]